MGLQQGGILKIKNNYNLISKINDVGNMTLDDLSISEYEEIISKFLPQMKPDMCYSASITNIVNELGERYGINGMKYSISKMNKLCGYKEGFQCNEDIVPDVLCEELEPFGYLFKRTYGRENNLSTIEEIIKDEKLSYPMISVSNRYFDEIHLKTIGRVKLDHSLIILGINHKIIYFYDPYEKYLKKSSQNYYEPRTLDKIILNGVWDEAKLSRCIEWIEPLRYTQEKLY